MDAIMREGGRQSPCQTGSHYRGAAGLKAEGIVGSSPAGACIAGILDVIHLTSRPSCR